MKAFIIFFTSILLVSSIIFSCTDDSSSSGQAGSDFDSGRDGDVNNGLEVVCRSSGKECSGSDCCGEDEDCADTCDELFNSFATRDCKDHYTTETVNKIDTIVDVFSHPIKNRLYEEEILKHSEPLCTLLEFSPETWIKKVEGYNTSTYARTTLEWIVSQNIWYYFISDGDESLSSIVDADKKGYLLKLIEQLIDKLGGARVGEEVSDAHLLNGLTVQEVADEKTIFYLADSEADNNNTGFYFVHNEIVVEKICAKPNRPVPNTTKGTNKYTGASKEAAKKFAKEACILAVYCKAGPYTDNQYEAKRKKVAELIASERNIKKHNKKVQYFIETTIMDGGLGVEEDASDWPNSACSKLRSFWENGTELGLGV